MKQQRGGVSHENTASTSKKYQALVVEAKNCVSKKIMEFESESAQTPSISLHSLHNGKGSTATGKLKQ
jgi:hypothetical protein